jgi:hypothetical protein
MSSHPPAERKERQINSLQALAAGMLHKQPRLWRRFLAIYAHLGRLPRRWRRRIAHKAVVTLAGAALLLALGRGPAIHAAAINVDDGQVAVADDGFCSLPEAIVSANDDDAPFDSAGECEDGSGDDLINLPANGNFTLTEFYDDY